MNIEYTDAFKRQLRRLSRKYRHIKTDVQPLIDRLALGATPGDQVPNTGYTIYKVRVRNSDVQRGKSGGYRVIYYLKSIESILLVAIYSKTEQSDIEASELAEIIRRQDTE